jgi:hypothetical protein
MRRSVAVAVLIAATSVPARGNSKKGNPVGAKLKAGDLVGVWNVAMKVDLTTCPENTALPNSNTSVAWTVGATGEGIVQVTVSGDSGMTPTSYNGTVENGYLNLWNAEGQDARIELKGSSKLLTGRALLAVGAKALPKGDSACAILYTVTAQKQ